MLPNQMDDSQPAKAYAKAQVKEVMNFRQFVAHIAEHGGHKRGQVKGVCPTCAAASWNSCWRARKSCWMTSATSGCR